MQLHFTKMQGAGNDYIYVNGFIEHVADEDKPSLARRLSDRHFGVGGDGLIFINPSQHADFEMQMYNADGSRGEMCGNGIRCVGKYVYDHGMTGKLSSGQDKADFTVESCGKIKKLSVVQTDESGRASILRVNMGAPILEAADIPVVAAQSPVVNEPIEVQGQEWHMTCVSMGNPHAVVYVKDVDSLPLETIGPLFEHHARFPRRTNTEFVQILNRQEVKMRVWERGTGETLACGTGCCAVGVAGVLCGVTDNTVTVHVRGGDIQVRWDQDSSEIWMTGPAAYAFDGTVEI